MKFKYEHIKRNPEHVFIQEKPLEKDCITLWKEKEFTLPKKYDSTSSNKPSKVFERNHHFEWDLFQWADSDFVNWVNRQPPTMVLAVMAEMKQSPRINPELEEMRTRVLQVPFYSLEKYVKKKRLGERSTLFLKEMKKRYGKSLLRILFLTSDT